MTEQQQAAMRQALEALESCTPGDYSTGHVIEPSYDEQAVEQAITAIREALAEQPAQQQEPVEYWTVADGWVSEQAEVPAAAWIYPEFWDHCKMVGCGTAYRLPGDGRQPLYASPPEQQEELQRLRALVRAQQITIEKLEAQQQEPIRLRRGDVLRCIETDELCTVWATSTTGKTLVKWSANNFGEYTAEQIGELFWLEPAPDDLELAAEQSDNYAAFHAGYRFALAEQPAQTDWEAVAADQAMTIALLRAEQPAQQQEPVAWVGSLKDPQPHCVTDLKYCSAAQWDTGYHLKYIPLYTSPPASKPWVGLTNKEIYECEPKTAWYDSVDFARAIEAKLREKNGGKA